MIQINLLPPKKQTQYTLPSHYLMTVSLLLSIVVGLSLDYLYWSRIQLTTRRINNFNQVLTRQSSFIQRIRLQDKQLRELAQYKQNIEPFEKQSDFFLQVLQRITTYTSADIILNEFLFSEHVITLMGESYSLFSFQKWIKQLGHVEIREFKSNPKETLFYYQIKITAL